MKRIGDIAGDGSAGSGAKAPPLPRREANKSEKRARIIDAARTAFYSHGFEDTKLSDVAHSARVAKGTLFLYATTKETLLWLVFMEDGGPSIMASLDPHDARPLPETLADHYERSTAYHRTHPELARVAIRELIWARPISTETADFSRRWRGLLCETIAMAIARGECVRAANPDDLAGLVIDIFYGAIRRWLTGEVSFEESAAAVRRATAILFGSGPATPPEPHRAPA